LAVAAALCLVAGPTQAHPESAAPSLRSDVVAAGHSPDVVPPHSQWMGFLDLAPGSNVTSAYYQVCRVGEACFAPPTLAIRDGDRFKFHSSDYLANGRAVDYQAGWHLGVTWVLEETAANGTSRSLRFPEGPDLASAECQGDAALACAEAHYFVFDVAAGPKAAPSPPGLWLALALAALAAALRK
jgi:hypothetical protein